MGSRVQTGCSNCKRCTNSAIGEGGRKAGRATAALATGGLTEMARLGTRNCRACGHKMSLHVQASVAPVPTSEPHAPSTSTSLLGADRPQTVRDLLARRRAAKALESEKGVEASSHIDLPAPAPAPEANAELADQLARLADLKASGVLTDEEFASAKARLLG